MEKRELFCNPVPFSDGARHTNPDPFILRWCGRYYCYATDEWGVKVSTSMDLVHWEDRGYALREEEYRNYWAPSVLYDNGRFYMYYSNVPKDVEDCHQEFLKLAESDSPDGPFQWKKTFFEKFSIDSHPQLWNGKLYMFYSVNDWTGTDDKRAGTCILADEMVTPWEFAGTPKEIVMPGIPEEIYERNRFKDGRDWYTIEGAAPFVRENYFWILYSANAYVNENYFIGFSVADSRKNFMDMEWKKYPDNHTWHPLLKKNMEVEGCGHNTVTKAPNMVDDWIVYHGRRANEELKPEIEQREMYIEPLYVNGRELKCLGPVCGPQLAPVMPQIQIHDQELSGELFLAQDALCYYSEFWISAAENHVGARYGIFLSRWDIRNYIELQIHSGKQEIQVIQCIENIRRIIKKIKLPEHYDYRIPHFLSVRRCFAEYEISVDERVTFTFRQNENTDIQGGTLGIRPYFSHLILHSFAMTETVSLCGEELQKTGRFFELSEASADTYGLTGKDGKLFLERENQDVFFTEEFQLEPEEEQGESSIHWQGRDVEFMERCRNTYSVCHVVRPDKEWFLINGKEYGKETTPGRGEHCRISLTGTRILEYRYTKN